MTDSNDAFKKVIKFFKYSGSYTKPPCTEGIDWFVVQDTVKISSS